jgi:hypothetical protein
MWASRRGVASTFSMIVNRAEYRCRVCGNGLTNLYEFNHIEAPFARFIL